MITAVRFFLGSEETGEEEEDEESEPEVRLTQDQDNSKTLREVMTAFQVAKKNRKRKKQIQKAKAAITKEKKKKKGRLMGSTALYHIYDPQDFAEKFLRRLEGSNERYEYKLLMMNLLGKTIGVHKLLVLNFYPVLQRYLKPHQRDVTHLLLCAAQASHELVPPEIMQTLVKTVADNFVTERNAAEVITVGLNAIREICANCPLAVSEDLLQDLTEYASYKNKNVSVAARSLVQLYRTVNPGLLRRKDRGRPTEFTKSIKEPVYGANSASSFVPGTEVLDVEEKLKENSDDGEESDADSEGSWEDMPLEPAELPDDQEPETSTSQQDTDWKEKASLVSSVRILSQEEHRKIASLQLAKKLQAAKPRHHQKRTAVEALEDLEAESSGSGLPKLASIQKLSKKPKEDKAERMMSVMAGREGREKFNRPKAKGAHVGRTNKKMQKNKAFTMVKYKQGKKKKRSFREKQIALKNYLIKQKKMK